MEIWRHEYERCKLLFQRPHRVVKTRGRKRYCEVTLRRCSVRTVATRFIIAQRWSCIYDCVTSGRSGRHSDTETAWKKPNVHSCWGVKPSVTLYRKRVATVIWRLNLARDCDCTCCENTCLATDVFTAGKYSPVRHGVIFTKERTKRRFRYQTDQLYIFVSTVVLASQQKGA